MRIICQHLDCFEADDAHSLDVVAAALSASETCSAEDALVLIEGAADTEGSLLRAISGLNGFLRIKKTLTDEASPSKQLIRTSHCAKVSIRMMQKLHPGEVPTFTDAMFKTANDTFWSSVKAAGGPEASEDIAKPA